MTTLLLPGAAHQLIRQRAGVVHRSKCFGNRGRAHGHGSGLFFGVDKVPHQRLNVAVEDQADDLGFLVDDRTAGVAADDVGHADEVELRLEIELALAVDPALRQFERIAVLGRFRLGVEPFEGRVVRNLRRRLDVAPDGPNDSRKVKVASG